MSPLVLFATFVATAGAWPGPTQGPPCNLQFVSPTPTCGTRFTAQAGQPFSITVTAYDDACRAPVFLEAFLLELPGATATPPLPTTGNPASVVVEWLPAATNVGTHNFVFHAVTDCCRRDAWCNYSIEVTTCPPCIDPRLGLGAAGNCMILELGEGRVSMTGPNGGLLGDVCIAADGRLTMSGSTWISGDVHLGPGASFTHSGSSGAGGAVFTNVDLRAEITAALSAADSAAAHRCTRSFDALHDTATIFGSGGLNVICVNEISLSGGKVVTLVGGSSDVFILNVLGKVDLSGESRIVTQGIAPSSVLLNVRGTGPDIHLSGSSRIDGTLLAPSRKIAISPGLIQGAILSGRDIAITHGGSVRCPSCR